MKPIRILIVDDEPLARRGIRQLIERDPRFEILGERGAGLEALAAISEQQPDLVFLDVQMPRMNGFELLAQIPDDRLPMIIFVTAHDRYAVDAFEAEALDYLLKPFSEDRFHKALARACAQIEQRSLAEHKQHLASLLARHREQAAEASETAYLKKLMVRMAGNILFLSVDEIDWIEAADYYALLHVGSRTYPLRESLADLEGRLDPARFVRIHRSALVNIERIKQIQPQRTGECLVVLGDGTSLKMSRRRREHLRQTLHQSLFS